MVYCAFDICFAGMSIRQQRRAMAEARSRQGQAAGGACDRVVESVDGAADVGRVVPATALRTPAAQLGLQVVSCVCGNRVPCR